MRTVAATIRCVEASEAKTVARSVDEWTPHDGRYTLQQTFPQVYASGGSAIMFGVFDEERLLSHAAVCEVRLTTPRSRILSGLIGGVATNPGARGHGHASRLLGEVLGWCRRRHLDSAMLWSPERGLYTRLGFQPAGRQQELEIQSLPGPVPSFVRAAEARDIEIILELHRSKPLRVSRSLQDMENLLSIPGMRTMVLERNGTVAAYACYGKGSDFPNWWHEMGGADADVCDLLAGAMTKLCLNRAMVLVPPYRPALRCLLGNRLINSRTGNVALRLSLTAAGESDFFIDGLDSI